MLALGSIVLGAQDVPRAIAFWTAALGYRPRDDDDDPTWAVLVPRSGHGSQVALMLSDTPAQDEPRVHLDLYAGDAADQAAEIERLIALGAQRVTWERYPPDADFVVLADTEGNRFCVIDTGRAATSLIVRRVVPRRR